MEIFSEIERRSDKGRRSGKERRQYDNPQYNGPERRRVQERRLILDRRSQTLFEQHFH